MTPIVIGVARSSDHTFSKGAQRAILLLPGVGVDGDAHSGITVKHRSRVRVNPNQPNLRQVHLIHSELHDELRKSWFNVAPGDMGENITTRGINLLSLSEGTHLQIGSHAVIEITGLRNPCAQLDRFQDGLLAAVLDRDENGNLIRKAGIMAIVLQGGEVTPGDHIVIQHPDGPHRPLVPV